MSCFVADFKHKRTGEIVSVFCIDDYFGRREYGFRLPDGKVLREDAFSAEFVRVEL